MLGNTPALFAANSLAFVPPPTTPNRPTSAHISAGRPILSIANRFAQPSLRSTASLSSAAKLSPSFPPRSRLSSFTALASHKGLPEGGYSFNRDAHIFLHLAAREAGSQPIAPEHLLIVFLERLDLSLLTGIGITADAVRGAIGNIKRGTPEPISIVDKVVFNVDSLEDLEFSDDLHALFNNLHALEDQDPISKDALVKGLLSHMNNDPSFRMQTLLAEVIDQNHEIDRHIEEFLDKRLEELGENGEELDLDNFGLDDEHGDPRPRLSFSDPSNDPDGETFYDALESHDKYNSGNNRGIVPQPDYMSEAVRNWLEVQRDAPRTPTIDKLGHDLTMRATKNKISYAYGRDKESLMLSLALQYYKKGSAIIVGPPGCGKTALVEGLAKKIVEGEVEGLEGYRLVSVSVGSLLAGTQYRGMLEKNVQDIIKEAQDQKIILFIDEIHGVIGSGKSSENTADIGNLIKAAQGVKWIGATTSGEYTRIFKKDEALNRRFERIDLSVPDRETVKVILEGIKPKLESHYNITYSEPAIQAVINYCSRYVAGHSPDKEITALDRAGAWAKHNSTNVVGADQVAMSIEKNTGIPLTGILNDSKAKLPGKEIVQNIVKELRNYVIGQDKAVDAVANAIFQSRTGVNADRPFVLVFAGPTGTGKTELVKAISKVDGREIIEINLETVKQISTLKGAEPGYVGHGEEGTLTGPQKLKPYSVVLFDEMEKTTDEVIRALLGLLDNGKMTDSSGEEVSFKNSIIVFTTNYGAKDLNKKPFGFDLGIEPVRSDSSLDAETIKKNLGEKLGPEVVGRFTNLVVFQSLQPHELIQISRLVLNNVGKDIERTKNLKINYGDTLIGSIAEKGYDPNSGARAIRRICDELVRGSVSHALARWPELNSFDNEHSIEMNLMKKNVEEGIKENVLVLSYNDDFLFIPVTEDLRNILI